MRPSCAALLVPVLACATADTRPDGGAEDAADDVDGRPDSGPCTLTWYADDDGDAFGDPDESVVECGGQPPGYVMNATDCDDTTEWRRPGLAEWCDGLDNDCFAGSVEVCPGGCVVRTSGPGFYLFCTVASSWSAARTTCLGQLMRPLRVNDLGENDWVRTTGTSTVGAGDFWIGGSDLAEGVWEWDDDAQFWQGGAGGSPVGGLYANWLSGEPNDDNNEDCAEMKPDGRWNDVSCGEQQPFACERYGVSPD